MSKKAKWPPPEHLSDWAKDLWREIVPRRARSPERRALLRLALEAHDRAGAARVTVEADGMICTTKTTGAVHVHPLVKVEQQARKQFLRAWALLGLNWDQSLDGRIWRDGEDEDD